MYSHVLFRWAPEMRARRSVQLGPYDSEYAEKTVESVDLASRVSRVEKRQPMMARAHWHERKLGLADSSQMT